ncbi:MAG: hypothetical protein H0U53_06520 [Actinobacteria bacterium]|nr:hypothetical protein [Actinomycetota bacterium]
MSEARTASSHGAIEVSSPVSPETPSEPSGLRLATLKATSKRRSVRVVLILVLLFAATDWPLGVLSEFWVNHPLTVSLVSGLVLLGFAVFLVESFAEELEIARRKRIVMMSFRALAQEVKDVRTRLYHFLTGNDPNLVGVETDQARLVATRSVLKGHPELEACKESEWRSRLAILLKDDEWVAVFLNGIRETKRRSWESLARWSPIVLSTSTLQYFDEIASLNYEINELQDVIKYGRPATGQGEDDWTKRVMEQWSAVMARSVRAEELLRAQAEYAHPGDFEKSGL